MLRGLPKGCGQRSSRECHRFRDVGTRSASELEYRFLAADDLNLIDFETGHRLQRDVVEVRQTPASLTRKVEPNALQAECSQNFVTSVKLNPATFIAGATMSNDSSPLARTGTPISSTFDSMCSRLSLNRKFRTPKRIFPPST